MSQLDSTCLVSDRGGLVGYRAGLRQPQGIPRQLCRSRRFHADVNVGATHCAVLLCNGLGCEVLLCASKQNMQWARIVAE